MVDCGNLHRTNMAEEELDQKPSVQHSPRPEEQRSARG